MPITATQVQNDIVASLAPVDPNSVVLGSVALYWSFYADQAAVAPRLQEFYTTRRCVDLLLRTYASNVDVSVGQDVDVKQSQITKQLQAIRDAVEEEIQVIEKRAALQAGPVVGAITTTAPITPPIVPPIGPPDANDIRYRGTAYAPLTWPRG